jgi:hypothetical protein
MEHVSKWVDSHLMKLVKVAPTSIRDSHQVVEELT